MNFRMTNHISLILCESAKELGKRVFSHLQQMCSDSNIPLKLIDSQETWFKNNEVKTVIKEPIRGDDVYIMQLLNDPLSPRSVNDNFIALLTAIDAAHQSDAGRITVIVPQFPYARQERRKEREGITAKLASRFMEEVGAERIITIDIHAEAISGFFDTAKMDNLHASNQIMEELKKVYSENDFTVVAPDTGGTERARFYAKKLSKDFAIIYKARNYSTISTIETMKLIGNVQDKDVFVVDDMIDTGGTMMKACELLKNNGAKRVMVACTFPFFSGNGVEIIQSAYDKKIIDLIVGTDAVFRGSEFISKTSWYREVSVAKLFGQVIYNINQNKSISVLLG